LRDDFLQWKSLSTPGAALTLKEIGRETKPTEGLLISYELYVTGFSSDGLYDLATWPAGDSAPKTMLIGVSVDKTGRLYCAGKSKDQCKSNGDVPLRVTVLSRPGKPFRYALFNNLPRTNPAAIIATTSIIPEPIESHDGPCSLSVMRLTSLFEVGYLRAMGFTPNSFIDLDGISFGERHIAPLKTDDKGTAEWLLLPFVAGHSHGTTKMKVSGASCSPSLKFNWGEG